MTLNELIAELLRRGLPVTPRQVHSYIADRSVSRPRKDGSGNYGYFQTHADEIERRVRGIRNASSRAAGEAHANEAG